MPPWEALLFLNGNSGVDWEEGWIEGKWGEKMGEEEREETGLYVKLNEKSIGASKNSRCGDID